MVSKKSLVLFLWAASLFMAAVFLMMDLGTKYELFRIAEVSGSLKIDLGLECRAGNFDDCDSLERINMVTVWLVSAGVITIALIALLMFLILRNDIGQPVWAVILIFLLVSSLALSRIALELKLDGSYFEKYVSDCQSGGYPQICEDIKSWRWDFIRMLGFIPDPHPVRPPNIDFDIIQT